MKSDTDDKTGIDTFSKKLVSYSLLAGMAVLLPTAKANAAIIHTDIADVTLTSGQKYFVNFDGDGAGYEEIDIHMHTVGTEGSAWTMNTYSSGLLGGANTSSWYMYRYGIMAGAYGNDDAIVLNNGDAISAGKYFYYNVNLFDQSPAGNEGNWNNQTDKYLGVKFILNRSAAPNATVHYGWVRMSTGSNYNSITIKDFAYENTPGQSILAGALPASNNAPTLTGLTASKTFTENTVNVTPQIIDNSVAFVDTDGGDLDTGVITITGIRASEAISVENQAVGGVGNIRRNGNNIQVSNGAAWTTFGVVDGSDTGAGTNLKITFNANSTPTNVDALIQRLNYQSGSQTGETVHNLTVKVSDGDGGDTGNKLISITVTSQNDPPTDISASNSNVDENQPVNTKVGTLSTTDADD